jgi:4-hydroxy-tetrahydrodipicolinate synthase
MTKQFSGVFTALATPFSEDGEVDWTSLEALIEHQLAEQVDGIVAVGTTGESPTLDPREHVEVIRKIQHGVGSRTPVIAGTGSNSTREAVELTREADALGVDGILQVAPYYNKPSQDGLFQHFTAVARATERPVMLYSIPGRCGIQIDNETAARLYECYPHVCAMKEAGGPSAVSKVTELRRLLGPAFSILSGDDGLTLPFIAAGADGVVSVASNLLGKEMVTMVRNALRGDFTEAREAHRRMYPLFSNLFCQPNPVPLKAALKEAGIIASAAVRPPLTPMPKELLAQLSASVAEARGNR